MKNGSVSRGGLKTRTSTPALRRRLQNGGRARQDVPSQSYSTRTVTPARARSISASPKAAPDIVVGDDEVLEMHHALGGAMAASQAG